MKNVITKKVRWRCIKCGSGGLAKKSDIILVVNRNSRWQKFSDLIVCPECGDDKGHCGIFNGLINHNFLKQLPQETLTTPSEQEIAEIVNIAQSILSKEKAKEVLRKRGYDDDLIERLIERGVGVGSYRSLLANLPANLSSLMPNIPAANEQTLWLPIWQNGSIVGYQLRRLSNLKPKYVTVTIDKKANLYHLANPPEAENNGHYPAVFIVEGILKAEVAAHYLKVPAVGILGTGAWRGAVSGIIELSRKFAAEGLFNARIALAPDADFRDKLEVARAWWNLANALMDEGLFPQFAIFSRDFNGIDDALVAKEKVTIVDETVWLAAMSAKVREKLLKIKVKPRILLDYEIAKELPLQISLTRRDDEAANIYANDMRKRVWFDAFKAANKVVIDRSATGSGKTTAAATLKVSELCKEGLEVKKIVYIAPEIKRTAVPQLEKWKRFKGRDETCQFWDKVQAIESSGMSEIGSVICRDCPLKGNCEHYQQRKSKRKYWRISWMSYNPKGGDFVILDEFSRLPFWREIEVTKDAIKRLRWEIENRLINSQETELRNTLAVFDKLIANLDKNGVNLKDCWTDAEVDYWKFLRNKVVDYNVEQMFQVRDWIFKGTGSMVEGFWWFEVFFDVLKGGTVGSVWAEEGKLKMRYLDPKVGEMVNKAAGILILDATVDPDEVERITGIEPYVVSSETPQAFPTTIQVPVNALPHRTTVRQKEQQIWVAKMVVKELQKKGILPEKAKIGVLTHKDAAEIAQRMFGKDAVVGWWGRDDRATNAFYDAGINVLVAVGLPHRNLITIAAEKGKIGQHKMKTLRLAPLDKERKHWTVLKEFADIELAEKVRGETEIAYLQAAGRLRQGLRGEEKCYFVVIDTEPLPEELNPTIMLPENVLPTEIMENLKRTSRRGSHEATKAAQEMRRKVKSEKLAEIAKAVWVWRTIMGDDPPTRWLTKAAKISRKTLRDWILSDKPLLSIRYENIRQEENSLYCKWIVTLCQTYIPDPLTRHLVALNSPVSDYRTAIALFLFFRYPVPVRQVARKFKVSHDTVSRKAKQIDYVQALYPKCPDCRRPFEFFTEDGEEFFVCHGCGTTYDLPDNNPLPSNLSTDQPADQPTNQLIDQPIELQIDPLRVAEPVCPACDTPLEPEPDGLAACVGCGRVYCVLSKTATDEPT